MSLFAPNYDPDIFINYSHADNNEPLDEKDRGWVAKLHDLLEIRLQNYTGEQPLIWRDKEKVPGNGKISPMLAVKLQNVALLVPIISPSYLTSNWCIPELTTFYERACKAGNINVDNESRIFKVVKMPIHEDSYPQELKELKELKELRGLSGYEFYADHDGVPQEYSHISGSKDFSEFVRELNRLAFDISRFVGKLCRKTDPSFRTIYLAETTADLRQERDKIKYELEMHNYCVLPDKPLPAYDGTEFRKVVSDCLGRCGLSIHLIGGETGYIPAKEKRDNVYLQHQLAMERQSNSDFFRVVWTPIGLKSREPEQQKFINYLRTRSNVQLNAELMLGNTKLSCLKTYLLDKLKSMEPSEPKQNGREQDANKKRELLTLVPSEPTDNNNDVEGYWGTPPVNVEPPGVDIPPLKVDVGPLKKAATIYLIFDKKDVETVRPMYSHLLKRHHIKWPILEAGGKKVKQIREEHERNMAETDAVIIFYGKAKEIWIREKLNELKKSMTQERTKPQPINILYITDPSNPDKEFYENTDDYQVLRSRGGFSEATIQPFVEELQKRLSQIRAKGAAR